MIDYCAVAFFNSDYLVLGVAQWFEAIYCRIPFYVVL